jgi:hypothetical protein
MAKAVCVLDKVLSGYNGPLESVQSTLELENGMVVALGGKVATVTPGSAIMAAGEVKVAKEPKDVDVANDVFVLHYSVPINYAQGIVMMADGTLVDFDREDAFSVGAGKIARAYHLHVGDMITIADSLILGATVVGQFVVPLADSTNAKTLEAKTTHTTERLVFRVFEKKSLGQGRRGFGVGQASTTLEVIRV